MNNIIILIALLFSDLKTIQDLYAFIESDKTNEIPYSETFDCVQYSETLIENAVGFDVIPVMVGWYSESGLVYHEFVAFEIQGEIIWIEPQNDREYIVADSGQPLCYKDGECATQELYFMFYDGEFK